MDVAVIGAGPAGLMAAIAAAQSQDTSVTVFEKNDAPGRKLLLTGGGRCNITHRARGQDWLDSYFENGKFLFHSFSKMSPAMINAFFERHGVPIITEKDGRCFPEKGKAKAVLSTMMDICVDSGVRFEYGSKLTDIKTDTEGMIRSVHFSEKEFICRTCILAVGGMSYPSTGSSGDGYKLARILGHRIVDPRPALAPISIVRSEVEGLAGVSCKSVGISLKVTGKKIEQTTGDLLYTHEGLSGPGILRISRALTPSAISEECNAMVGIDFVPDINTQALQDAIKKAVTQTPNRKIFNILRDILGLMPIAHILERSGIPSNSAARELNKKQINTLISHIKELPYHVAQLSDFNQAMVTMGGVDLKDIHPQTMASRQVPGLYFAGEVMNIDGDTGGYNLQAAFSTGFVAGLSAAKWVEENKT